jgi:hypothetical protein
MDDKKRLVTHHETRWSMGVVFRSGGVSAPAEVKIIAMLSAPRELRMSTSADSEVLIHCMESSRCHVHEIIIYSHNVRQNTGLPSHG